MAKKTAKKKTAASGGGIAKSVRATAAALIGEAEKAGEVVLKEVRDGLATVTDKVAATAKTLSETQAAQTVRGLVDEIEEVGSDMLDAVGKKLDQLRGKVAESAAGASGATRSKAAKRKSVTKKRAAKKKAVAKKQPAAKKKAPIKKVARKKPAVKKKAAPKKKTAAKRRSTPKATSTAKRRSTA